MSNYVTTSPSASMQKINNIKNMAKSPAVLKRFEEVLGNSAKSFVASIVSTATSNPQLLDCDPNSIFASALVSATLNLSCVPTLGQSAIVPYKGKGQFQIMTRGLIQLAQRSGSYRTINCGSVYEDELVDEDILSGDITLQRLHGGYRDSGKYDKIIGYFAYFETISGFKKTEYWTKEEIISHARRFSKSFDNPNGVWAQNFDAMAEKTVLKSLLNHYGELSVDSKMVKALEEDQKVYSSFDEASYADNPDTPDREEKVEAVEEKKEEVKIEPVTEEQKMKDEFEFNF